MKFVYKIFTIQNMDFFFFFSGIKHSAGVSRTKMASEPIHSILFQGIVISLDCPSPKNPPGRQIISAVILPSRASNSKSVGQPSLVPSHRFITSFSLRSHVLNLSIKISFA